MVVSAREIAREASRRTEWGIRDLLEDLNHAGEPWVKTDVRKYSGSFTSETIIQFERVMSQTIVDYIKAGSFDAGRFVNKKNPKYLRLFLEAYDKLIEAMNSDDANRRSDTSKYWLYMEKEFHRYGRDSHHPDLKTYIHTHMQELRTKFVDACNMMNLTSTRWAWARKQLRKEGTKCSFAKLWKKTTQAPESLPATYTHPFV